MSNSHNPIIPPHCQRFVVDPVTGCWLWTGSIQSNGYGKIRTVRDHNKYAHRVMFEANHGPIPDGAQVDHLCGNRRCVNPDHLEAVAPQENVRRACVSRFARRQRARMKDPSPRAVFK